MRGHDLTAAGKRADAIMKTRGIISSLCFVEIKRHDTPLLGATQYRPDVWPPSAELVGGVSQVQTTVHTTKLYRRHTWRPEIITFDELLQRARFIVEHGPDTTSPANSAPDDMPF